MDQLGETDFFYSDAELRAEIDQADMALMDELDLGDMDMVVPIVGDGNVMLCSTPSPMTISGSGSSTEEVDDAPPGPTHSSTDASSTASSTGPDQTDLDEDWLEDYRKIVDVPNGSTEDGSQHVITIIPTLETSSAEQPPDPPVPQGKSQITGQGNPQITGQGKPQKTREGKPQRAKRVKSAKGKIGRPRIRGPDNTSGRRFQCELCPDTFSQNSNLSRHRRHKHGSLQTICKICGETLKRRDYLSGHMKRHLNT